MASTENPLELFLLQREVLHANRAEEVTRSSQFRRRGACRRRGRGSGALGASRTSAGGCRWLRESPWWPSQARQRHAAAVTRYQRRTSARKADKVAQCERHDLGRSGERGKRFGEDPPLSTTMQGKVGVWCSAWSPRRHFIEHVLGDGVGAVGADFGPATVRFSERALKHSWIPHNTLRTLLRVPNH
jgi:hypothetical protein